MGVVHVLGRPLPSFIIVGYAFVIVAGLLMLVQSFRASAAGHHGAHALTARRGQRPPWTERPGSTQIREPISSTGKAAARCLRLALGISLTIGLVAVLAILFRSALGTAVHDRVAQLEEKGRWLQACAAVLIIGLGAYAIVNVG
jgi:hypothetical protein